MISNWFFNAQEKRLRAGWRLALYFGLLAGWIKGTSTLLEYLFERYPSLGGLDTVWLILATFVVTNIGIVGITYLSTRFLDRRPFASIAIQTSTTWWKELAFGLGLGAFLMTTIFLSCYAAGYVKVIGLWTVPATNLHILPALAVNLLTFTLVGFHEELSSRGYQLTNLAEGFSRLPRALPLILATVLSSTVFGAAHFFNPNATVMSTINIALCGVMLAMPYLLTGRLAISIGLHITWNFFQTCVFGFSVSGLFTTASVFGIQQLDSGWFTGGAFGPEAGLFPGLLAMLLGMVLIVTWVKYSTGRLQLCNSIACYQPGSHEKAA